MDVPFNCQASDNLSVDTIRVTWECGENNVDKYHIFRNGVDVGNVPAGTFTFDDTTVPDSKQYEYFVESWNDLGVFSDPSNIDTGRIAPTPEIPSNFVVTCTKDGMELTWDGFNRNIIKYEIFRDSVIIDTINAPFSENLYVDTETLTDCTEYTYYIKGYTALDETAESTPASAKYFSYPNGELVGNWDFNCGLDQWCDNFGSYPGTVTDNGDGTVTLTAGSNFASIHPCFIPEGDKIWLVETKIDEITGNGKGSIRYGASNWVNVFTFNAPGVYRGYSEGDMATMDIGANGDSSAVIKFDYISVKEFVRFDIPCMTSPTAPYGQVTVSSEFGPNYPGWEGMNCAISSGDCWLGAQRELADVPDDGNARGDYFEWQLTDDDLAGGKPEFAPSRIEITPRGGMSAAWWRDHNPKSIAVFGIKTDGTLEEIYRRDNIADWANGDMRGWDFSTANLYRGIRVYITKVNLETSSSQYNTGWSNIKISGMYENEV
jgi:hypothetical protein